MARVYVNFPNNSTSYVWDTEEKRLYSTIYKTNECEDGLYRLSLTSHYDDLHQSWVPAYKISPLNNQRNVRTAVTVFEIENIVAKSLLDENAVEYQYTPPVVESKNDKAYYVFRCMPDLVTYEEALERVQQFQEGCLIVCRVKPVTQINRKSDLRVVEIITPLE